MVLGYFIFKIKVNKHLNLIDPYANLKGQTEGLSELQSGAYSLEKLYQYTYKSSAKITFYVHSINFKL